MQTKFAGIRNTLFVLVSLVVGETISSIGQDDPPRPFEVKENNEAADQDAAKVKRLSVSVRTSRQEVEAVLGEPADVSVIPSLRRAKAIFDDGTEVIYLDNHVISFRPGKDARQNANGDYVVTAEGGVAVFRPETLRTFGLLIGDDAKKRDVEDVYYMRPPPTPPYAHGDFPYGPSRIYHPAPWPVHAERVMPVRLRRYLPRYQHLYYDPEPYVVPSPR